MVLSCNCRQPAVRSTYRTDSCMALTVCAECAGDALQQAAEGATFGAADAGKQSPPARKPGDVHAHACMLGILDRCLEPRRWLSFSSFHGTWPGLQAALCVTPAQMQS